MFVNWLKRRAERAIVQSSTQDLERFLESLRGMDPGELGTVVVAATVIRVNLENAGLLPHDALGVGTLPIKKQSALQFQMSEIAQKFQRQEQYASASGAKVWLFTLRACTIPEARLLGRKIWKELSRGFPHVLTAIDDLEAITHLNVPQRVREDFNFIPPGLEPG
jgi:hypothetical protein